MRHILLTGLLAIFTLQLMAATFFVKPGGTGKGTNWSDATEDLIAVLLAAQPGDQVFVAKGTYYPTQDRNRRKSFIIPSGVKVFGGFAGNETSPQQRNLQSNKSILSGNIGSKADLLDNSYTVVFFRNANDRTLFDGFVIADGNADGTGPTADRDRCGAGMYVDGSGTGNHANPMITNCIFQNNTGRDGGAVYLNGRSGESSPTFSNCQFLGNTVDLDGGALFNDGRHGGKSNPTLIGCTFSNNAGNYGGAVCNYGGKGESSPVIRSCVFRNNEAYLRGGAIFNMDVEGITQPVINDCQFVDNKAVAGKGMYTFSKFKEKEEGGVTTKTKMN